MAGFTSLLIGTALGAGLGLMAKKGKKDTALNAPVPYDQLEGRRQTSSTATKTPAQQLQATNPPDAVKSASENVTSATQVATRARRRASAGSAGRVSTGSLSASQRGVSAMQAPRTLLGY